MLNSLLATPLPVAPYTSRASVKIPCFSLQQIRYTVSTWAISQLRTYCSFTVMSKSTKMWSLKPKMWKLKQTNNIDHLVKMQYTSRMYRKQFYMKPEEGVNCLFVPVFSSLKARPQIKWWFTKHTVSAQ